MADREDHPLLEDKPDDRPPAVQRKRPPRRRGADFTQLPNWVRCKLNEARAGGATWATAHAIEALVFARHQNPLSFYQPECAPKGDGRYNALRTLKRLELIEIQESKRGMAPIVLCKWRPRE
jgi:hypothetical protein